MIQPILLCLLAAMLSGCSISFQNIDTHGMASDLVDEAHVISPESAVG